MEKDIYIPNSKDFHWITLSTSKHDVVTRWFQLAGICCDQVSTKHELRAWCRSTTRPIVFFHLPETQSAYWKELLKLVNNELANTGHVVLIAPCDSEESIVAALKYGAKDFISTASTRTEFFARMKMHLYKQRVHKTMRIYPPYTFDIFSRELFLDGSPISLTEREFKLALFLFENTNTVLTRERLLKEVWGIHPDIDTRRVDVHICKVRVKMGLNMPDSQWQIKSVYQAGYRLEHAKSIALA